MLLCNVWLPPLTKVCSSGFINQSMARPHWYWINVTFVASRRQIQLSETFLFPSYTSKTYASSTMVFIAVVGYRRLHFHDMEVMNMLLWKNGHLTELEVCWFYYHFLFDKVCIWSLFSVINAHNVFDSWISDIFSISRAIRIMILLNISV